MIELLYINVSKYNKHILTFIYQSYSAKVIARLFLYLTIFNYIKNVIKICGFQQKEKNRYKTKHASWDIKVLIT